METLIRRTSAAELLATPWAWPWNIVLRVHQFTQSEILEVRDYCDIYDIVRFQAAATYDFVEQYFTAEVDASDMLDWKYVAAACKGRV